MWIELFLDSFGVYSTRNTSVTGVYISFSNIRRQMKHFPDSIYTVMLIPPNVSLKEALQPIRSDLIKLQQGYKALKYEENKATEVEVKGAISALICDHPQACELSRHLGTAALMNCRMCWVNIKDKSRFSEKFFNHHYTRRRVQTDLVVRQMESILATKNTKAKTKELQKKSGIRCEICPLHGVEVDPHLQSFPDFDHFFDLGLCMRLFNFICESLSTEDEEKVHIRLKGIKMPRVWNSFALNLRSVSKKMKPMTYIRKLCILGVYLFKGLIHDDIYKLLIRMIKLRGMLLQASQTDESVAKVRIASNIFLVETLLQRIYDIICHLKAYTIFKTQDFQILFFSFSDLNY